MPDEEENDSLVNQVFITKSELNTNNIQNTEHNFNVGTEDDQFQSNFNDIVEEQIANEVDVNCDDKLLRKRKKNKTNLVNSVLEVFYYF